MATLNNAQRLNLEIYRREGRISAILVVRCHVVRSAISAFEKQETAQHSTVKHNSFGNETQLLTFCSWIVLLHDITNHYPHVRCVYIYMYSINL